MNAIENNPLIEISSDKTRLDIDFIHAFLTKAYWAKGRAKEEIKLTIEHSLCYGIYLDGQQIGFTRVLTDYAVFAYLMDVFIDENHRGKAYSKQLLNTIFDDPTLANIQQWALKTGDAHGLYEQFGFKLIKDPERWMVRKGFDR